MGVGIYREHFCYATIVWLDANYALEGVFSHWSEPLNATP